MSDEGKKPESTVPSEPQTGIDSATETDRLSETINGLLTDVMKNKKESSAADVERPAAGEVKSEDDSVPAAAAKNTGTVNTPATDKTEADMLREFSEIEDKDKTESGSADDDDSLFMDARRLFSEEEGEPQDNEISVLSDTETDKTSSGEISTDGLTDEKQEADEVSASADMSAYLPYNAEEDAKINPEPDELFTKIPAVTGKHLYTPEVEDRNIAQSISDLCDNLLILTADNNYCNFITVTSPMHGDGKTTVALLMAMALGAANRVLLADCDFFHPHLHRFFNCMNKKGIRNVLLDECSYSDVILNTDMPNLKFVTAGVGINPREINGKALRESFKPVENNFDYIILDTVSVNRTAYPSKLAAGCEGAVMVVKPGTTTYMSLEKASRKLKLAEAPLLGIVLNGR